MSEHSASVLVVDDDTDVNDVVTGLLREAGFAVTTASTGWEALALIEVQPFDLMVVDIGLTEGLNGLELAKCARLRHPTLKCLFVSGSHAPIMDEPEHDDFVAKPFYGRELLGCVWELLQRKGPALELGWGERQAARGEVAAAIASRRAGR